MDKLVKLDDILRDLEVLRRNEAAERLMAEKRGFEPQVSAVVNDSRKVCEGALFVAIDGNEADGHRYLGMAKEKGALAAVTTRLVKDCDLPQFVVADSREALALASAAFYGWPSRALRVTGITGSNGKTSCAMMLREIFLAGGEEPGMIGTVLYSSKRSEQSAKLTTPDATLLQKLFAEMRDEGLKDVIMEVSSIGRDQKRDAGIRYQVAALINIGREHLDYHKTFEAYLAAKKSLVTAADEKAFVVLNADDPNVIAMRKDCRARVITFGHREDADVKAERVDLSSGFAAFDVVISKNLRPGLGAADRVFSLKLSVPGYHSVMNALAAFAMGLAHHLPAEQIVRGLMNFHGVERRFQNVFKGDFLVFDDHFANPNNIDMSLETMKSMSFRRLHIVYAIRGKRGVMVCRDSLAELGKYKEMLKDASFHATYSTDVVGYYDEVTPEEKACFEAGMAELGLPYTLDERLADAICRALDQVEKGDVLLLAGCQGMDAGARILLEELARRHPAWDREKLMAPLRDRFCGWGKSED